MSTSGYLVEYDVAAFERHLLPLAGKDADTIVAALEAHPDALLWDDETRELMHEADEVNELLRRAFSAWCVPDGANSVSLGRNVTLEEFTHQLEPLDATGALKKAVALWARPPKNAWRIDDEFELMPASRAMLEELWARAAALGMTPLDEAQTVEIQRSGGDDARLTLAWVGRVLQTPGRAVAYFYESLPAPQKKAPLPANVVVLQDLLAQEGHAPWDYEHEGELIWLRRYDDHTRVHASLTLDGQQHWVNWRRPSTWKRLFGTSSGPEHDGAGPGPCADPSCRLCKAATHAAEFLNAK